jgi:murein DD-endopeptidase MepM/ murein hydrolase activator NlpD
MQSRTIRAGVAVGAVLLATTALAAAAPPPRGAETGATAAIVRITVPGQPEVVLGELEWPATTAAEVQSFAFPDDGAAVATGASRASVTAQTGSSAVAQASADTIALSLFGGDVVAAQVTASASAGASARSAGADVARSSVQGLRVLGADVPATPGTMPLGDWGVLHVLAKDTGSRRGTVPAAQGGVSALRVVLTAARGGLPAGTEVVIAEARATAVVEVAEPADLPRGVGGSPPAGEGQGDGRPQPPEPQVDAAGIPGGPVRTAPPGVGATLTKAGYVFPIFGSVSFGDSFGAPRPNVPGRWHHGEDLFAPLGAPVLAVADGTLHSIGFIPIGGYRLWLRDGEGNEFYYAHLAAYSPLAVEGKRVEAGDVIGFVGATGDAEGGTPHLHFEIHPAAMIGLGYDGVVAPYPFLLAWRRAEDVSFAAGRIFVPSGPNAPTLPPPGAVLLQAEDIGPFSGLVPGALENALERKRG